MKFILILGVVMLVSSAHAQAQNLNMICGLPQPACDAIVAEFSQQTGIDVSFIRLSAGEAHAKIRSEARNPKTDIWFAAPNELHYQAAEENLTQPYQSLHLADLVPQAQKMAQETDYKSVAFAMGAIGFAWNQNLLRDKNFPEPKCWADLLRPDYKGEIALSNPNTAGTGYSTLVALVALMGEDGAFDYLKKLNPNISSYTKSGSAVVSWPARGDVTIGVAFLSNFNVMIAQGFPLTTIAPCEGTGYALHGVSIIKGARNLDSAKAFMDWILSVEGQNIVAKVGGHIYPALKGTPVSEYTEDMSTMKLLDLDQKLYGSPEMRKKLLDRWNKEIGAIAGQ